MTPKVYLERSVISYVSAWPSRDLIRAAHQQITREWWETRRSDFDLFVSQIVIDEVSAGDSTAASERLELIKEVSVLEVNDEAKLLAGESIRGVPLPAKATLDAAHIAIAVVSGMDYLLTWNCSTSPMRH